MAAQRNLIIAVFGSTETGTCPVAAKMGAAIATAGHILLTGGTGTTGKQVKNQAISGAAATQVPALPARWIGVDRDTERVGHYAGAGGFVVETDLGHKRNCLEACLCDGAVALEGKEGTASEAVACLALGKPVAFVGSAWKAFKLDQAGQENFTSLIQAALKRIDNIDVKTPPWTGCSAQRRSPQKLMRVRPSDGFRTQLHR